MTDTISKRAPDAELVQLKPDDNRRKLRMGIAFAVAAVSDLGSIWLEAFPPLEWLLDLGTAGLLFLLLGRQWMILPGLIAEAIPGLALFPSWLLVVGSISAFGSIRSRDR